MNPEPPTVLLTDPMAVSAFLAALVGVVFWLSARERLAKLFGVVPPVIYVTSSR